MLFSVSGQSKKIYQHKKKCFPLISVTQDIRVGCPNTFKYLLSLSPRVYDCLHKTEKRC